MLISGGECSDARALARAWAYQNASGFLPDEYALRLIMCTFSGQLQCIFIWQEAKYVLTNPSLEHMPRNR